MGVTILAISGCLRNEIEFEPTAPNPTQAVIVPTATPTPRPSATVTPSPMPQPIITPTIQPTTSVTPRPTPQPTIAPTLQIASEDGQTLHPLLELTPTNLGLPEAQAGSKLVNIGLFLTVRDDTGTQYWTETEAAEQVQYLIPGANFILAQCNLHLALETAQVVALPERLLHLQGNESGSWGGHPPPGTENVELFNYRQNERLTGDTRELFTYGKQHTSPNTIAVFTVEHITYYAAQRLSPAGGLSFAPNIYHHPDDYPMRNSVLLTVGIPPGYLPAIDEFTIYGLAHEIGHMLLNTGDHERDQQNLMASLGGVTLTSEQCERMHRNLDWLYGDEAVPDPGPPTEP